MAVAVEKETPAITHSPATSEQGGLVSSQDIEKAAGESDYAHFSNSAVRSFTWKNVSVSVKAKKQPAKLILDNSSGCVHAGQMVAIMGPSGCGKTTLLNVLAHRAVHASSVTKEIRVNGGEISLSQFRDVSCYVEQEDALLGGLTVKETLNFAARLSLPHSAVSKTERIARIEALLTAFGLQNQKDVLIGTPIRKGISGGQKRRVTVASQLITGPKILFLDEPTSGLDSMAAYEVMLFVKNMAVKYNLLVIASIHQPSTATYMLFSQLLLLSAGSTVYNGPLDAVPDYFASHGHLMPNHINPAEFALQLVNTDFATNQQAASEKLSALTHAWTHSTENTALQNQIAAAVATTTSNTENSSLLTTDGSSHRSLLQRTVHTPITLIHRSFLKATRDVIAYGIRLAMYLGLAILMGTVWLRLEPHQRNIGAFTNALFYGGAFLSFMAVAYIPSYLEDRTLFAKERDNGLYGAASFTVANFAVGVPFLFLIALLFSLLVYWMANFRPAAEGFGVFVMWLFLDLLAAEGLVVMVANVAPIFVVSLAAVAFANGLWMSVNGFMVPLHQLNVFWRYVFHYIDYQAYVFKGMMVNEFEKRTYSCRDKSNPTAPCHCIYVTDLQDQCLIGGKGVLREFGFNPAKTNLWTGIMLCIIFAYRLFGWAILYFKRT